MAEPYRCRIPLRRSDVDARGRVDAAVVVDYLQEARVSYLLTGPNAHLLGHGVIVVAHQVEHLAALGFSTEPLDIALSVGDVGASRFTIAYEASQRGGDGAHRPVLRARTHLCVFDFATQRPARLAPDERAAFVADSAELAPLPELGPWRVGESAHAFPVLVRWSDLDSYGHVNNTRFFTYLGEACLALLAELGEEVSAGPDAASAAWRVLRQDVHYVGQIEHRLEPYRVRTAFAPVEAESVTVVAEIDDPLSGAVLSRATTVLGLADAFGRPGAVPDAVRSAAARWPAEAGTGRRMS